jgi:hypothetical protein
MLVELKQEMPGLKLSQYKVRGRLLSRPVLSPSFHVLRLTRVLPSPNIARQERIFAMWQKDPSNPMNQAKAAGLR